MEKLLVFGFAEFKIRPECSGGVRLFRVCDGEETNRVNLHKMGRRWHDRMHRLDNHRECNLQSMGRPGVTTMPVMGGRRIQSMPVMGGRRIQSMPIMG